ncbi:MAG: sigma-54-dependent Fis family transcriptional regulator [Myxococcales bacterium]|nr:sigma-54-dependent Fis family transcriptional regulator [Myxococcales bacterium]
MSPLHVLVVDDERNIRTTLRVCLETVGHRVSEAASADDVKAALVKDRFDVAFVDLRLGEANGLDLIPILLAHNPLVDVVIITAFGTIQNAVDAVRRGAREFVTKPFTPEQIRQLVTQIASRRALEVRVDDLKSQLDASTPQVDLETRAPGMREVLDVLHKAASYDVPVFLRGENGTGKTILARRLHALSARAARPFVVVNCPTLSEELLSSELFGHARGAFTGAVRDQMGRVEAANGGTLFLDEIGELPSALQAKLLRFVQDHQFERVGETQTRSADVRIVAATNRDVEAEVKAGRFREDLLFRLNTLEILVPPLRERREDIVTLAHRFLAFFARTAGARRATPELTREAETALVAYEWPGNVRELRNAMERASILAGGSLIGAELLPRRMATQGEKLHLGGDFTLDAIEREHIRQVMARVPTAEEAARVLGIDSSTLWRKRKRYEEGS